MILSPHDEESEQLAETGKSRKFQSMPMDREAIENLHPGNMLLEDYLPDLKARNVTRYRLAKELHITQSQLDELLAGKRNVTANIALRLGKFFNQSPGMWLGMQNDYDLAMARLDYPEIESIKPFDFNSTGATASVAELASR
jgi:addiction module HigA family antidote